MINNIQGSPLLDQIPSSLSNPGNYPQELVIPQFPISHPKKASAPSWVKFHLEWFAKGVK